VVSPKARYQQDDRSLRDRRRELVRVGRRIEELKPKLRNLLADDPLQADDDWALMFEKAAADSSTPRRDRAQLVNALIEDAHWVFGELRFQRSRSFTKQDLVEQQRDLLESLERLQPKLRLIAPELQQRLPISFDPVDLADRVADAVVAFKSMAPMPDGRRSRVSEVQGRVVAELAGRVLQRFDDYGLTASAHASRDDGKASAAVLVLVLIGEAVSLVRTPETWGDALAAAKSAVGSDARRKGA
jgi:hypothetical protein